MTLLAWSSIGVKAPGLATGIKKPAKAGLSSLIAKLIRAVSVKP